MYRQICILLLVGTMLLAGCSGKNAGGAAAVPAEKPIYEWGKVTGKTITIWGNTEIDRPYMTRAFDRYKELTGNTIEIVYLSAEDLDGKVPQAFATAEAEKPDILLGYGGTNVEKLNPDENFYDFTDAPWVDDLTDTALNQTVFNGKVIGLPHGESSISGTLYNKEIFEKYNIEIPKTQEEFLNVCDTLQKQGVIPMFLPYTEITMLLYQFPMDTFLTDRKLLDGLNDGTLSYAQIPEMKKIVEWYKTMGDRGYFGTDYLENNWSGMEGAMKNGDYAMMLCWDTWLYTNYSGDPSKIGLMPAFIGVPENGCFEGANINMFFVNKNSSNLDSSLDFINFLADPMNYNVAYDGVYTAPIFNNQTGSNTTPQYMESELLIDELFYDSVAWSRIRGFSQIDAKYIQNYMQGQCSLEECLQDMDTARVKRAGIKK